MALGDGFDDTLVVEVLDDQDGATMPVIRLTGDIDMLTSQRLRSSVADALEEHPGDEVVFDIAGVGFVDSSGLSVLINIAQRGRRVVLRHPTDTVRRVIETTGLTTLLHLDP